MFLSLEYIRNCVCIDELITGRKRAAAYLVIFAACQLSNSYRHRFAAVGCRSAVSGERHEFNRLPLNFQIITELPSAAPIHYNH